MMDIEHLGAHLAVIQDNTTLTTTFDNLLADVSIPQLPSLIISLLIISHQKDIVTNSNIIYNVIEC